MYRVIVNARGNPSGWPNGNAGVREEGGGAGGRQEFIVARRAVSGGRERIGTGDTSLVNIIECARTRSDFTRARHNWLYKII